MSTPLRYRRHHAARVHHAQTPPPAVPPPCAPPMLQSPYLYASNHPPNPHTPPLGSQTVTTTFTVSPIPYSPVSATGSPKVPRSRANRPFDRGQRTQGQLVDPATVKLESEKASVGPDALSAMLAASTKPRHGRHNLSISNDTSDKTPVSVRLPSRHVTKHVSPQLTAAELALALVREHRLEFNFEDNTVGEDDEIIVWECVDGTRRPLRPSEKLVNIVQRWDPRSRCYLRTTSTSLRNDVDSLASLVPRRDMLRAAPELDAAAVHFSRPSVMYNPRHEHGESPYGGSARPTAARENSSDALRRVPSRLSPNDHSLAVRRVRRDNDDVPLHSKLVWGFGALTLTRGRIEVKQKPGDELVCSLDIGGTDVYEWPHNGPKRYVVVLRAQNPGSRAVYVCTDSARVFSVLRNAVFTARTKTLMRS